MAADNISGRLLMPPPPVKTSINKLQCLADACGQGDAKVMLELSEYLREKMPNYQEAANMWLLRAAIYGNIAAQQMVQDKIKQNPHFLKKSMIPYENFLPGKRHYWHAGRYPGYFLNAVGLLAFQPRDIYMLAGISEQRTMLIWQENDYDSPDESGFGAEQYYNMFYLDEFFQLIPEVHMVYNVSSWDIDHVQVAKKSFEAMTNAMLEFVSKKEKPLLWTEFVPKEL